MAEAIEKEVAMATKEVDVAGLRVKIGYAIHAKREAVFQQIIARDQVPLLREALQEKVTQGAPEEASPQTVQTDAPTESAAVIGEIQSDSSSGEIPVFRSVRDARAKARQVVNSTFQSSKKRDDDSCSGACVPQRKPDRGARFAGSVSAESEII